MVIVGGLSERDAYDRRIRGRRWHVLQNGADIGVEASIVTGLGVEHREPVVQPAPEIVSAERQTARRCAAEILRGNRYAEGHVPDLEEIRGIDEEVRARERLGAAGDV